MAGGSQFRLIRKSDDADFYQKTEGGPWWQRKRTSYTIAEKIKGEAVSGGSGGQGDTDNSISFSVGNAMITRVNSNGKFVCKEDAVEEIGDAHAYVNHIQTWVWESSSEEQISFD